MTVVLPYSSSHAYLTAYPSHPLNHPTDESVNSGPSSPPEDVAASSSHIEDFLLRAIENPANADDLAQALKNCRVRDCLRDRGIKVAVLGDEVTPDRNRIGFYKLAPRAS